LNFKLKHFICKNISKNIPTDNLGNLAVLMFHSIPSHECKSIWEFNRKKFKNLINKIIDDQNMEVISNKNIYKKSSKIKILITFDDGYKNNYQNAFPILEEYNLPFSIFMVSNFMTNLNELYLNKEELIFLSKSGICEIGCHGVTHRPLAKLSKKEIFTEIYDSKKRLEDEIGKAINIISYPHGSVDESVLITVKKMNFNLGFSSKMGLNKVTHNNLCLKRIPIYSLDSTNVVMDKIYGKWDWVNFFI
jgi:peptidoglycan/xylan/chitin deacetylase (PgdA/CDA1 family)